MQSWNVNLSRTTPGTSAHLSIAMRSFLTNSAFFSFRMWCLSITFNAHTDRSDLRRHRSTSLKDPSPNSSMTSKWLMARLSLGAGDGGCSLVDAPDARSDGISDVSTSSESPMFSRVHPAGGGAPLHSARDLPFAQSVGKTSDLTSALTETEARVPAWGGTRSGSRPSSWTAR